MIWLQGALALIFGVGFWFVLDSVVSRGIRPVPIWPGIIAFALAGLSSELTNIVLSAVLP